MCCICEREHSPIVNTIICFNPQMRSLSEQLKERLSVCPATHYLMTV